MYLDIKNGIIKHSEESLDEVSYNIVIEILIVWYLQHYATSTGLKAFMIDIACKGMEVALVVNIPCILMHCSILCRLVVLRVEGMATY